MDHERHHGHLSPSQIAKREVVEQIKREDTKQRIFRYHRLQRTNRSSGYGVSCRIQKERRRIQSSKNTLFKKL